MANTCGVVAERPAEFRSRLFIGVPVADCGTADAAPVTPLDGVVIGTPEGVFAGSVPLTPFVVLVTDGVFVIGDELGLVIGDEFGFGVGEVVIGTPPVVFVPLAVAEGLTIGLEFGFGLGLEFGFGVGELVTGVAAAGFPELLFDVPAAVLVVAAGLLLPAGAAPLLLGAEVLPLEPPVPPPPPELCP